MADEARDNLSNEAESSTSMYMALLKEMRAINTNITSMHDDISELVVVNEDSDMPENGSDVDDADGEAEREGTDTASVVSVDTKGEQSINQSINQSNFIYPRYYFTKTKTKIFTRCDLPIGRAIYV
jgi:hypothetical protein